jgi:transposase
MEGLEAAFRFFGGVPSELLFDQMRSVVIRDLRPDGGRLVENAEFLRFAEHWGFRARACRPYRAQTKGKVERPIRYLRRSFFYGRSFVSDADLDAQLQRWLAKTANVRVHGTTGERPLERFEAQEREVLLPLAPRSFEPLVPRLPRPEPRPRSPLPRLVPVERRPLAA